MNPSQIAECTVVATNLPEHARNAIHTDDGAVAAGFPRALVAGVTTYAYLAHPVVAGWGLDWLAGGGAELRLLKPVFDRDAVVCRPRLDDDAVVVDAVTDGGSPRAIVRATPRGGDAPGQSPGEVLPVLEVELTGEFGTDYGIRAGDPFSFYVDHGAVHPAVWPALANTVVHEHVARGPWIHVRSSIRHHGLAPEGATAHVHAVVIDRFERSSGTRAIVDVRIVLDGRTVASIEHEAIVELP